MSVINTQPLIGASGQGGGYNIDRSLRFRSGASAYFNRTLTTPTSALKYTFSCWVKRGVLTTLSSPFFSAGGTDGATMRFEANDTIRWYDYNGAYSVNLTTTAVYRDTASWYHVVFYYDSTQATASDRAKIYINGTQVTSLATATYPTLNQSSNFFNTAISHNIGRNTYNAGALMDGYMAEIYFIDGQGLTPSSFGETDTLTGVWKPKKYAGTYGTNGFYLNFKDNSAATAAAIGKDSSGNGNNWTPNNISVTAGTTYDSMTDVPTLTSLTAANYAVLNPLNKNASTTVDNANLRSSSSTVWAGSMATMAIPSTGKYYAEATVTTTTSGVCGAQVGLCTATYGVGQAGGGFYGAFTTALISVANNGPYTSITGTWTAGDIIQIAADSDNGKIWIGRNNVWYDSSIGTTGNPSTNTNATIAVSPAGLFPEFSHYDNSLNANFGQRPFAYTPPTGFKALNTYNLPDSTIKAGNKVMDATLYTGTNTTNTVTNSGGFKPDLIWMKNRGAIANHGEVDSVRGTTKLLFPNLTNAENTYSDLFSSFNSNGFTLGNGTGYDVTNGSGNSYVAWQWQAGQGTTSSNTSGSITSTVSVNASSGFSIVTYTGTGANATVGHGLGVAPKLIILKQRNAATDVVHWLVYHVSLGNTTRLLLNTTDAAAAGTSAWNSTTPTSTVFSLGAAAGNNAAQTYVAYCWSEVAGFSKFGSYTGNGSADGPFIYTGFRPKFYLFKRTDSAGNWYIFDTARGTYNISTPVLFPNRTDAESSTNPIVDFLSNGIKIRSAVSVDWNASGGTYIYMAFAENPFKNSLAR